MNLDTKKVYWLTRFRWIAISLQLIALPFGINYQYIPASGIIPYLLTVFILIIFNILSHRKLKLFKDSVLLHLSIDFIAFIILIILSGKLNNPFWDLIYLHTAMSAFALNNKTDRFFLPLLCTGIFLVQALSSNYYSSALFNFVPLWIITLSIWITNRSLGLIWVKQNETIAKLKDRESRFESYKSNSLLTSGILHEFGTPLNTFRLKVDRLIFKGAQSFKEKDIKTLDSSLSRLESIIKRINTAQFDMTNQTIEVFNIKNFLNNLELINQYDIHIDLISESHIIRANKEIVSLFIMNCLQNCNDFNITQLSIQAFEKKDKVHLQISDQGEGFASEILKNFKAPYTTTKGIGRGLGLFQSYNSLLSIGAKMEIYNDNGANIVAIFEKDTGDE